MGYSGRIRSCQDAKRIADRGDYKTAQGDGSVIELNDIVLRKENGVELRIAVVAGEENGTL